VVDVHPHGSVLSHPVAGVDGPVISLGMYRPDLVAAALAAGLPGGVLHTGHRRIAFSQEDHSAAVTFDNGVSVEAVGVRCRRHPFDTATLCH